MAPRPSRLSQGQDQGGLRGQLRLLLAGGQHRRLLPRLHQGGRPHRIHEVRNSLAAVSRNLLISALLRYNATSLPFNHFAAAS